MTDDTCHANAGDAEWCATHGCWLGRCDDDPTPDHLSDYSLYDDETLRMAAAQRIK